MLHLVRLAVDAAGRAGVGEARLRVGGGRARERRARRVDERQREALVARRARREHPLAAHALRERGRAVVGHAGLGALCNAWSVAC